MADIDLVLERLVTDPAFRAALAADPAVALASYDLSERDLQLLASSLDHGDDAQRGVEQRTSKSAMVGLLASLTGGGGGGRGGVTDAGEDVGVRKGYNYYRSQGDLAVAGPIDTADLSQDAPPDDARYGSEKWRPSPAREDLAPPSAGSAAHWGGPKHTPGRIDDLAPPVSSQAEEHVTHDIKDTTKHGKGAGRLAPDADALSDKPRPGEITMTRSQAAAGGNSAVKGYHPAEEQLTTLPRNRLAADVAGAPATTPGGGKTAEDLAIRRPRKDYTTDPYVERSQSAEEPAVGRAVDGVGARDITQQATWQSSPVGRVGGIDEDCDGFLTIEDE